jgi:hypothetical protein
MYFNACLKLLMHFNYLMDLNMDCQRHDGFANCDHLVNYLQTGDMDMASTKTASGSL